MFIDRKATRMSLAPLGAQGALLNRHLAPLERKPSFGTVFL